MKVLLSVSWLGCWSNPGWSPLEYGLGLCCPGWSPVECGLGLCSKPGWSPMECGLGLCSNPGWWVFWFLLGSSLCVSSPHSKGGLWAWWECWELARAMGYLLRVVDGCGLTGVGRGGGEDMKHNGGLDGSDYFKHMIQQPWQVILF